MLILYNRPDLARSLFARIAEAKPKRLFVVADGPKKADDEDGCRAAREVVQVDWDCDLQTSYSPTNMGCAPRIVSGINWVFEQVDCAIFLEDDTFPSLEFFGFCDVLLDRYRDDTRVFHIGGNNFQRGTRRSSDSYYFSRYAHGWGWATWKRAWRLFDPQIQAWPMFKETGLLRTVCPDPQERLFWSRIFDRCYASPEEVNAWDFQWLLCCWCNGGHAIVPEVNLVSNHGFGSGATHTMPADAPALSVPIGFLGEIRHPRFFVRNEEADRFTYESAFNPSRGDLRSRIARLLKRLRIR